MQIACGDKYENEVVQKFNKCALSVNGCVPKRIDSVMEWPVGGTLVECREALQTLWPQVHGLRFMLRVRTRLLLGLKSAAAP